MTLAPRDQQICRVSQKGDHAALDATLTPRKTVLVDCFRSGKHKKVVKGFNLIALYYTDPHGASDSYSRY